VPWFHRKSDEEKQAEQETRQEQTATIQSLERGGIPIPAQQRLDDLRSRKDSFFTSDLSVSEFLLSRQASIRPLSQVMGSSVYHIGWQYWNDWYGSGELTTVSQAYTDVRNLALGRMRQEAERIDANVVLGVHITSQRIGDGKLLEFQAFGTAARFEGAPMDGPPALTNLSGQDFWKLYQAGYWPLGVVAGSTVYHAVPSWGNQWAMGGFTSWFNQELTDFTRGMYTAREITMGRVRQQAQSLGAGSGVDGGVVGVTLEQTEQEYEVKLGNDQERTDMIFTFHVIGTAIAELRSGAQPTSVRSALNLKP
jgi:uncharacterized protein YbjQ (UPF0145 family)